MKKIIIAGFIVVLAATSFAIYHQTREFSGAAAANLAPCTQNSDCDSGYCSNTVCCPAGTCGWGDDAFERECVTNGSGRENSWARLVCRNGLWKTRLYGWGCNGHVFPCDSGSCDSIGFCMPGCAVDPGVVQSCSGQGNCPSGTICNNGACCPAGYCGYGDGVNQTRTCLASGTARENLWARGVCNNGVWYTPKYGWGCDLFGACQSGSCQMIGDFHYCYDYLPIPSYYSSLLYDIGNSYCAGSCRSCAAQGANCGIKSDNCGGYVYCGTCASGYTCTNNQCVASCTPNCSGKVCGSDACGGSCGTCASGQTCNASGQCVASCTPATCLSLGKLCGVWNDNCGGTVNCGSCLADEFCNASGQCVASCVPATCSSLGKLCGVWNDNCAGTVNCGSCLAGQSCNISGQCVADDSGDVDCTPNFSKKCGDGHLYWYDSCGAKEGMAQNCGTDSATQNFQCRGNWVQQEIITRDCANGACTENKSWSDSVNCALSGKICAAGVCVANDITPPSLFGLSPSGTIYSANVALTVSTNEVSECRYGLQDMSFTSMALKFGSSNKTYHSASIILPSPGNYNYFVRCADTAGNAATASAKISFVYALPAQSPAVTETPPSSPVLPPVSDKTPPVISDALPAGDVFEGKVQISVTTDEKSSCKYDIAATDYDSMENFLESDGTGTFHSKEISISAAGNYAYYVNCKDDAGNEAGQSTAIKFNYVQGESGPAISEIAPEGAVYQGEIMLTAVTDVPAVCRYSGEDREFEEMTDLFSVSDDGLRQSAMITLGDYGNYNYHIRCRDEKGNTQGSYAAVSFEYKDPAAPVSGEAPVSLECYQVADGDRDGECDHTLDCVCDPDCPVDGEDADPDCANIAVQESGTNRALFIGIGLLLLLVLMIIFVIIIMRRKKSDQENQNENEFA